MPNETTHRIYVLLGCTACGKAAVGQELARRTGARILSVDSMKIYRRMDIGTAKPSAAVRAEIPHYGIDLVEPSETFSVARYVEHADAAIAATRAAGAIPLAVGGTSLYLKALIEGLFEGPGADATLRAELSAQGAPALHEELAKVDPTAAERINPKDKKRIIRALEVFHRTGRPISDLQTQWDSPTRRYEAVLLGLRRAKEDQNRRINARVKVMIRRGLREEVERLSAEPAGLADPAAQAVGYAELLAQLRGECDFDSAVEAIKIHTRRLAKKQRTWQRRFAGAAWFDLAPDESPETTADRILQATTFE